MPAFLVALLLAAATMILGSAAALAAGAPQITAVWVTEVGATAANLRAEANPNGLNTNLRFEYITAAAFQENLAAKPPREGFSGAAKAPAIAGEGGIGAGTSTQKVVQHLGLLKPNTTYDYRLLATNSAGTTIDPEGSPRTFTTQETAPVFTLPDNRGWEMVSPIDKNGGAIEGFGANSGGGVFQAAAADGAVTYSSDSSFGPEAQGAPAASQYISTRGEAGWSTQNITLPTLSGAYGDEPEGVPYQLFSADLARGLLLNGRRCEEGEPCPRSYSLRDDESGALTPLPEAAAGMRLLSASPDLRRIVFESEGNFYEWSGAGLVPISLLPPTAGPGAVFQAASAEGRFAFYTEAGHLYRYDASAEATTDLTPGGEVQGVLGASDNGSYVYYETAGGLFLWHEGPPVEVASEAASENYPPTTGTARVSPDGTHLAFTSSAALTSYENAGEAEVYLYSAAGSTLTCASCNPSGERPHGPSSIPGAIANGEGAFATQAYKPRDLSAGGTRLFFDSRDALALQDTNNEPDVYEWEAQGAGACNKAGGCIHLISSGRSEAGASFVDASASGSDAFFLTDGSLVPSDPGSVDLYDAREGGGFPVPLSPTPCVGDACQVLPPEPEDPAPGTVPVGQGNSPVHFPKTRCKTGFVRKHGKCLKKPGHKKHSHHRGGKK